ncbi:MAG TPA: nuclear transport factor 2 family protein [Burkholderiaceae bacterium]|nr:nuclear transport factor 2 family protein [Burkholderiaceae bacterium]
MNFETLLARFADAVAAHDSQGLAALFTADGCYDDYFFGRHEGRDAIAAMLDRFHVGGESFCWEFIEPVEANGIGYARYRFSYLSREPESAGRTIVFEGIARMRLRDGLIEDYAEAFDRGVAFAQLGYSRERIGKLLERYAESFRAGPSAGSHLEYRVRKR